jgi:hypothetical protein
MYFLNRIKYNLSFIFSFLFMIIFAGYYIYQLYPKTDINFLFFNNKNTTNIYIITSKTNDNYLSNLGILNIYKTNIEKLQKKFTLADIKSKILNIKEIKNLPPNSVIILPDIISVTDDEFNIIKNFLKNGGNVIFNYHFGYFNDKKFTKAKRIEEITKLQYIKEGISKENSPFLVPKVLSPFILSSTKAHRMNIVLYGGDMIPIFKSNKTPDFYIQIGQLPLP